MHLVADSGSTKTDWRILHKPHFNWECAGLNPMVASPDFILKHIKNVSESHVVKELVTQVSFFGAGCAGGEASEVVKNVLTQCFPNAEIRVESDLLAAAIAAFGKTPGVIGILGTGSNAAYYNGDSLNSQTYSLGYILGDNGAGVGIGKAVLKSYITGTSFWADFIKAENLNTNETEIIKQIYSSSRPNAYIAQYAKVALKNNSHPEANRLLKEEFSYFFDAMIEPNLDNNRKLGLVGSIAYFGKDLLMEVAGNFNCEIIKIIPQPINDLIKALEMED